MCSLRVRRIVHHSCISMRKWIDGKHDSPVTSMRQWLIMGRTFHCSYHGMAITSVDVIGGGLETIAFMNIDYHTVGENIITASNAVDNDETHEDSNPSAEREPDKNRNR